ncbi:MAG TPA: potassium transporter KefA [Eubacterium sp.]|nr:potassium transporter KefA [Eubacterium sp.]
MNVSMVRYFLGKVIAIVGILMLLPFAVALIYKEHNGIYFLIVALSCVALGEIMSLKKVKNNAFGLKEGCIATGLSWIALSVFGCLPFVLSEQIPSFTDALFETVSGFTTTGASILSDVEHLDKCMIFWRSFTHWIGGMGVLVFLLAIIPSTGGSNLNLMKAESPGPSVGKLVPKIKTSAMLLYKIYIGITITEIIFLLFGGFDLFEAATMSFGTAGTGGFGILNDSCVSYNIYCQWVLTIFMILFGINFNFYFFMLFKQFKKALGMEEVKYYLFIIIGSIAMITANIYHMCADIGDAISKSAFQVASIITTTGFSSTDFDKWPTFSKTLLVCLMFCGACAGSTGGGIKVSRLITWVRTVLKELNSYIHPRGIKKVRVDGKIVEHEVIRSINVYYATFTSVFVLSLLLISLENYDFTTNFTAVAATINNIGPGLSLVGPTCNFGFFNTFSKYVFIFDMLAGRLELFPMLMLFHPAVYKDLFKSIKKH